MNLIHVLWIPVSQDLFCFIYAFVIQGVPYSVRDCLKHYHLKHINTVDDNKLSDEIFTIKTQNLNKVHWLPG